MRLLPFWMLVVPALILTSCSGSRTIPDSTENRTSIYEPGAPNFDMEVVATIVGDSTGLDAYVSIPHVSLVFVKSPGGFAAGYELYVSIVAEEAGTAAFQETWSDSVFVDTYNATQAFEPIRIERRIHVPPGSYTVDVTLEDAESGAQMVRRQAVDVMEPGGRDAAISEILLQASRHGGPFLPTVSLHVASAYDSLQAVTQLYNMPDTADVSFTLVQFVSDATVADPPHWFTPSHFSLPYLGVDYGLRDTIQASRRTVRNASDAFTMEFDLPVLDKGVYMASVALAGEPEEQASRRYFTVRGPTFPRIASLEDMVASLVYIATESELEHIRAAESDEELKRRFDAFWGEREPNKQAAATLLSSYYERVEQANILYTNHKDGWKTDRGMIYIVFGPPAYVENRFTRRDWYYFERGSIMSRMVPPFVFRESTAYGLSNLFENFVLQRAVEYEETWRRKRDDWRDGSVL